MAHEPPEAPLLQASSFLGIGIIVITIRPHSQPPAKSADGDIISHSGYLILDIGMSRASVGKRSAESAFGNLPVGLLPTFPEQIEWVDGSNREVDVDSRRLAAEVQIRPTVAAEAPRESLVALVVLQRPRRRRPFQPREGDFVPHEEERRGSLAATCALAGSALLCSHHQSCRAKFGRMLHAVDLTYAVVEGMVFWIFNFVSKRTAKTPALDPLRQWPQIYAVFRSLRHFLARNTLGSVSLGFFLEHGIVTRNGRPFQTYRQIPS